jgi:hypothetical protein
VHHRLLLADPLQGRARQDERVLVVCHAT